MGSSYIAIAPGSYVLACDICGGGRGVRKVRCPEGYCPSLNAHPKCLSPLKADGSWAKAHAGCKEAHAAFEAREAAKRAEPGRWVRSAVGSWHEDVPDGMVGVVAHDGSKWLVPKADYHGYSDAPFFPHPNAVPWASAYGGKAV